MNSSLPQRILIVVTRRIGDVILATPVIHSLRQAWPTAIIDVLVFGSTAAVLKNNPEIDRIHTIEERPLFFKHLKLIGSLWRRYDLALSLLPGDRPTLYAFLAGKKSLGLLLANRQSRFKQWLLSEWVAYEPTQRHMLLNHLALLAPLQVTSIAKVSVYWSQEDERLVSQHIQTIDHQRFVVLHVYPKFHYKMWQMQGWVKLAKWLTQQAYTVVLTAGPELAEQTYVNALALQIPACINLAGQLSLSQTAALIKKSAAYVGPDTSVTHLAASLGVPTVTLFGPTDPVRWGPWPCSWRALENPWHRFGDQVKGNVSIVQGQGLCVPCTLEGCDRHIESYSDCLLKLPVERLIKGLKVFSIFNA